MRIDVCGTRTMDYVVDCLAKLNRPDINSLTLRAVGCNASRLMEIAHILRRHFGVTCGGGAGANLGTISYGGDNGGYMSCLELEFMKHAEEEELFDCTNIMEEYHQNYFLDYFQYSIALEKYLKQYEQITISAGQDVNFTISDHEDGYQYTNYNVSTRHDYLQAAFARAGLMFPENWREIAQKISEHDDIILGVDTCVLRNCSVTEHLIPSLILINPNEYTHVPNWMMVVVPSAVMQELEILANDRRNNGQLETKGRLGYRALQEILELTLNLGIKGVSLIVTGQADPMLDAKNEIESLRYQAHQNAGRGPYKKSSSGDGIIRTQYRNFLRSLDFHKGTYFLTADKSNAALAQTEGLNPIKFDPPKISAQGYWPTKNFKIRLGMNRRNDDNEQGDPITINVPLGKLVYELAVQFEEVSINSEEGPTLTLRCDGKGGDFTSWPRRRLMTGNHDTFDNICTLFAECKFTPDELNKCSEIANAIMPI